MNKEEEYKERYEKLEASLNAPFLSPEDREKLIQERNEVAAHLADLWE